MIKQINYMIDNLVDYSDKENFYKIKDRKIKYFKQDNSVTFCGEYRNYYISLVEKEIITKAKS